MEYMNALEREYKAMSSKYHKNSTTKYFRHLFVMNFTNWIEVCDNTLFNFLSINKYHLLNALLINKLRLMLSMQQIPHFRSKHLFKKQIKEL